MTLLLIVLATLTAGIGSVWLAALLMSSGWLSRTDGSGQQNLLSLAAGALLATAFMHLLPEAFESQVSPQVLFGVLLVGLVFFFMLDKAELWHHGHEHHVPAVPQQGHDHARGHEHDHGHGHAHGGASWAVLAGDSVHCFGDGVLIASAFVADTRLGLLAAAAVMAHELPHHMGDLVVLRLVSGERQAAVLKVSLAGSVTAVGGVLGYWLVAQLRDSLPFFLVVASSSFVYVALADLIPQLQKHVSTRQTVQQIGWLLSGMGLVTLVSLLARH
jgi:zinc and cadmium transporter